MYKKRHKHARNLLYEELRLIEKSESEVNGAWKGAHLLLFFLAFVFGSFCTFCFHLLMYLFEEKCVLFPKLLSLTPKRHNVIYELIPDETQMLPVDFVATQWIEKSACYLPTYVPLVSGIFGLVWTTLFLMCSTGSRTLTGLQRPWRVIPPVFVFSLAMGCLCIYTSAITHRGLEQLCIKLGEITGSSTCSYTINVATLLYERKIRGVYQATRLTITTAWLHTFCWILSAVLALARVLLVVDFRLVKVKVELLGDIEQMLAIYVFTYLYPQEHHEEQLRTVSPISTDDKNLQNLDSLSDDSSTEIHYKSKVFKTSSYDIAQFSAMESDTLFFSERPPHSSKLSLVRDEEMRLVKRGAFDLLPREELLIVKLLYDLLDTIELPGTKAPGVQRSFSTVSHDYLIRQYGQEVLGSLSSDSIAIVPDYRHYEHDLNKNYEEEPPLIEIKTPAVLTTDSEKSPGTSKKSHIAFESDVATTKMRNIKEKSYEPSQDTDKDQTMLTKMKSNLRKDQDKKKQDKPQKVKISDSRDTLLIDTSDTSLDSKISRLTQTEKEKQD